MPAGSSGSSETLSGARALGAGCWLGAQCSSDTFSASRRLVRLPCSTVASRQCSQGTKVEHARPLCKVGSESPPSLALRSHQPSKPEGWRQRRPLPGCVRFTFVLVSLPACLATCAGTADSLGGGCSEVTSSLLPTRSKHILGGRCGSVASFWGILPEPREVGISFSSAHRILLSALDLNLCALNRLPTWPRPAARPW